MIGVEGQYQFKFDIGSSQDVIKEGELETFTLIEEAGNVLPSFDLVFQTSDDAVLADLNEGNKLNVTFGRDIDGAILSSLFITKSSVVRVGDQKYRVACVGLYDAPKYVTVKQMEISEEKSAYEIIQMVGGRHFRVDINRGPSDDKQYWIQPSITDKQMVNHLWMHSYLGGSFTSIAITSEGEMRVRDMKKLAGSGKVFEYSNRGDAKNILIYDGDYEYVSNSGFLNHILGYGREKILHALEKGNYSEKIVEAVSPMLASSGSHNKTSVSEPRYDIHQVQAEDNVDQNYWEAFIQNLVNLATFSSHAIRLNVTNQFHTVKALDLVYFKDDPPQRPKEEASEFFTGLYVVTKVSRNLSSRTFNTTLELNRECLNAIKGSLK